MSNNKEYKLMSNNKEYKLMSNNKEYKLNNKKKIVETFENVDSAYENIIDLISVSPTAKDQNNITVTDQLSDYFIIVLKYGFLVIILTLNFLGLSVSLNCNADQEMFTRIMSAIFAFFFGFVYLIINYYTYKVLQQGQICKMNTEKLFPFNI